jgi:hypothetical protein
MYVQRGRRGRAYLEAGLTESSRGRATLEFEALGSTAGLWRLRRRFPLTQSRPAELTGVSSSTMLRAKTLSMKPERQRCQRRGKWLAAVALGRRPEAPKPSRPQLPQRCSRQIQTATPGDPPPRQYRGRGSAPRRPGDFGPPQPLPFENCTGVTAGNQRPPNLARPKGFAPAGHRYHTHLSAGQEATNPSSWCCTPTRIWPFKGGPPGSPFNAPDRDGVLPPNTWLPAPRSQRQLGQPR